MKNHDHGITISCYYSDGGGLQQLNYLAGDPSIAASNSAKPLVLLFSRTLFTVGEYALGG